MDCLSKIGFKAVNLYFSSICNLNCRYCFQPKIREIGKNVNDKIVNWVSSGKMEEDILKYFGPDIEIISLWGGEPSINLPFLKERLPYIFKEFPQLKGIQYSTNMSSRQLAKNTSSFIREIYKLNQKDNREVSVELQISIDGPPEINDYNRRGSRADKIMENISMVLENIPNPSEGYFHAHIKGTQSADSLRWLMKEDNLLIYYKYFDDWQAQWEKTLPREVIPFGGTFITLVYPGNYTQQDGFLFKKLIEKQNSLKFQNSYEWKSSFVDFDNQVTTRIKQTLNVLRRGYYREYKGELLNACSCSAGRSSAGLTYNSQFHLCQGTYMFSEDILNYIESHNLVSEFEENQGFSFRNYKSIIKDNIVTSIDDDLRTSRLLYKIKEFNRSLLPKVQYFEIMLSSLACAGQISECYKEEKWRDLATAYLIFGGNECPVDNTWEFGSPYIRSLSHLKLIFNGAFEYYVNNFYSDILKSTYNIKKEK